MYFVTSKAITAHYLVLYSVIIKLSKLDELITL